MKTKLLLFCLLGIFSVNAQTTHNLEWFMGIGTNVDLTIESGDTVIWTWGDSAPHTVENDTGNSVENFDSGTITGLGQTYSHTFTVVGDNDYFCGIHGAASMSGTISVLIPLSVNENELPKMNISPNPVSSNLNVQFSRNIMEGQIAVYDILGKQLYSKEFDAESTFSINVSNFKEGVYFVKVVSGKKVQTQRFIKN